MKHADRTSPEQLSLRHRALAVSAVLLGSSVLAGCTEAAPEQRIDSQTVVSAALSKSPLQYKGVNVPTKRDDIITAPFDVPLTFTQCTEDGAEYARQYEKLLQEAVELQSEQLQAPDVSGVDCESVYVDLPAEVSIDTFAGFSVADTAIRLGAIEQITPVFTQSPSSVTAYEKEISTPAIGGESYGISNASELIGIPIDNYVDVFEQSATITVDFDSIELR